MSNKIPKFDYIFYLYAPTDVLFDRIIKRGREYEKKIDIKYLDLLEKKYELLYESLKNQGINIIKLDWVNYNDSKIYEYLDKINK